MKEQTIRMLLLAGIVIVSAFIVVFFTKEFILKRGVGEGNHLEGFQVAGGAGTASPPPQLQKMMMVLLGPGSGDKAADGDVFISKLGTSFTSPKWEKYPAGGSIVGRIRIDGGGQADGGVSGSYLNIRRIRLINTAGTNVNTSAVATASSESSTNNRAANVLSSRTDLDQYHSATPTGEWLELNLSTPVALDRIEVDNRPDIYGTRTKFYTLRVYNDQGNEFYTKALTADVSQVYSLSADNRSTPMASITGDEGRLYATNSGSYIFATKPYTKTSEGIWNALPSKQGMLIQVSRDGRAACGVATDGRMWCSTKNIEFEPQPWINIGSDAAWISISNGRAAMVSAGNKVLSYTRSYTEGNGNPWWQGIQSNLGQRVMKQVVLDDTRIGALDAEGNIFMADLRETGIAGDGGLPNPNLRWFQVGGKRARYIEMRLGRVLIIAEDDGKIYYSDDYRYGTAWTPVALPTDMREVYMAAADNKMAYTLSPTTAASTCVALGATLATGAQLTAAWKAGANWCSCAWTSDSGRRYPNNEDATDWCGGAKPGVRDCGNDVTQGGTTTCYGKKPASGTANVAKFNSKFWNAPPLAIEFVPYSTVPAYCGNEGMTGIYKGARFRYYARRECDVVGIRAKLADPSRTTSYNTGNAECTIINAATGAVIESASAKTCVNVQDRPGQTLSQIWDDGATGNCIFNASEYWKKYKATDAEVNAAGTDIEALDIGALYEHFITKGVKALYSPCGDINPSCHWNPDAYYTMNPNAKKDKDTRDPYTHYITKGVQQGLKFCNSSGFFPLLDSLLKSTQQAMIVRPSGDLATNCTSKDVTTGAPIFSQNEAFVVAPAGGVAPASALATCQALGVGIGLATVVQLREAQLNGGEWCTAGWIQAMQYEQYNYSGDELARIRAGESEQSVCQVGGRIFSRGDATKAPGCGTAWCCRPTGNAAAAGTTESLPYYPVATTNSGCATSPGVYRLQTPPTTAAVVCYGPKPAATANTATRAFNSKYYSMFGGQTTGTVIKQWSCNNRAFADKLFAGPGNSDQAYLGTNDTVCFTDDVESKKYFCRSAQEYRNGEDYSAALSKDYDLTCNRMSQALVDLGGAITTINNIKGGLENGRNTISAAAGTLDSVYTKLGCAGLSAADPLQPTCKVINTNRASLLNYASKANTDKDTVDTYSVQYVYDQVLSPMQAATDSRAAILSSIAMFKCENQGDAAEVAKKKATDSNPGLKKLVD
jgi:hypothetical protein